MRNIIITGGELHNKGAQAMTFMMVDVLKKRFPTHEIFLLSELDQKRPAKERAQYAFQFMGWYPIKFAKCQHNSALRMLCRLRNRAELAEAENIYKNTDLMVDISGYALGSVWSSQNNNNYLDHLEFAKAFKIPVYLMPQSFGPFDFQDDAGRKILKRCKKLLPYAKVIYAREQEGYDELIAEFGLQNVRLGKDIVLCGNEPDLETVFREKPVWQLPTIEANAVGIIPNLRNNGTQGGKQQEAIYVAIVKQLLSMGKSVYLLCHSTQDAAICQSIKASFSDEQAVTYLEQDFNCIEFNTLVKRFQFLIASRFHAIVHAYKNGIPCVVLGWADKYRQLLKLFGQDQYLVDMRQTIDMQRLENTIAQMELCRNSEAGHILEKLPELKKEDVLQTPFL